METPRQRRGWTLVWVPGDGRRSHTLHLGPFRAVLGLCAILSCLGGAVWAGFQLQGEYGLRGHRAQQTAPTRWPERWATFDQAGHTLELRTIRQMRRRAALLHALRLDLGSHRTASRLLAGAVEERWRRDAERGEANNGTLRWPVEQGWFVRGFGSGEGGYHLAVDIMGDRGTDVQAAAPGVVGYAGHKVRGFGNMVILIHPGGWVTVYAHNQQNLVVAGERVKQGQVIALLGNTGISRGPHVHFEFIHKNRNCDPLPLFRPGVRHRAGHLGPVQTASWFPTREQRPELVRCAPRRRHPRSRYHHEHAARAAVKPEHPLVLASHPQP